MIAAIILAAGDSRRMGSPKALLSFRGSAFIDHILQQVKQAGYKPIISVLGESAGQILKNSAVAEFRYVINPAPQEGMLSSIKIALKTLPPDADGFLLALTDHPFVQLRTYREILKTARAHPGKIIIPGYQNEHGHPIYFDNAFFRDLLDASAEQSARDVAQKNKAAIYYLAVDDEGILKDIDTPRELEKYGLS